MTTTRRFFVTSALAAAMALPLYAYNDQVTHPQLTIIATEKSALYADGSIMFSLGLLPADKQYFYYGARAGDYRYGTALYPLSSFVGEGAFDEDIDPRALNHFFDPVFDRTLTVFGIFPLGNRSWRWMLEDLGDISGQDNSLADARVYLNKALTFNEGTPAESDTQRGRAMGSLFLSLGHAAHHMQDMAQPQHVRNDMHLDKWPVFGLNPVFNPSRYERYTAERGPFVQVYAEMANAVFPGSTNFKVAKDFWVNGANTGIAQFTNSNFVSQGTNFTMFLGQVNTGTYALPQPGTATDFTPDALFADSGIAVPPDIQTLCGTPAINCTMTMYSTVVSPRASTLSIFDQDLRAKGLYVSYSDGDITPNYQTARLFDLNRFNFDDAHTVLIGKAVAYSAGLINHFFRGKLEITAPASGPYAVVDHSTGQGFTKIRATVTNATPGEALPAGTIRAIAKFHRNGCYQSDLSGEFTLDGAGNLVAPCPNYRSEEAHVRLTAEESTSFAVGESKEMTFTFSDPIPLDATDLILQVLYRGTVGSEQQTFALGAFDLSEPTFVAVMNATDVFELSGTAFYYYLDIINKITQSPYSIIDIDRNGAFNTPPDVDVRGGDISYGIKINGQTVGNVPALPQGRFARLAALVSPFGYELTLTASGNGFNSINSYDFEGKTAQYDPDQNAYIVSPVALLRSQTLQFDSVTFYHYYPTTGTPLRLMPQSNAADATALVAVQMVP